VATSAADSSVPEASNALATANVGVGRVARAELPVHPVDPDLVQFPAGAEHLPHPPVGRELRLQGVKLERLDDVVEGAGADGRRDGGGILRGRHQNQVAGRQRAVQVKAGLVGQVDVEQHQVRPVFSSRVPRGRRGVHRRHHGESRDALDIGGVDARDAEVVVDDERADRVHGGARLSWSRAAPASNMSRSTTSKQAPSPDRGSASRTSPPCRCAI
jgi:hypothetical protein